MQYLGYLLVRRYNSVNSFSIADPVVSQMSLFIHMAFVKFMLWLWCPLIVLSHLGVGVMRHRCHEVAYVERGLHLSDASSSLLIANQRRSSTVASCCSFDPTL